MENNYSTPTFEFFPCGESNKVFFAGSGAAPSFAGSIMSMGSTSGQW